MGFILGQEDKGKWENVIRSNGCFVSPAVDSHYFRLSVSKQ